MEGFYTIYPETRAQIKSIIDSVPDGYVAHVGPNTRTIEQNKKLWSMLNDVARQIDWYGQKLSPYDWKHIFTASLKKSRAVPGIDGGIVVLGMSTSKMNKMEFADLLELMHAFGSDKGVVWTENAQNANEHS